MSGTHNIQTRTLQQRLNLKLCLTALDGLLIGAWHVRVSSRDWTVKAEIQ